MEAMKKMTDKCYDYDCMPKTKGFVFWFKHQPVKNFSDGEYAWTSFQIPAKCFDYHYYGNINSDTDCIKFHPTSKPIALYNWLLKNYTKQGDKILDTHGGSENHQRQGQLFL